MFRVIPIFNLKAVGRYLLKQLVNKWPVPNQQRKKVDVFFFLFSGG